MFAATRRCSSKLPRLLSSSSAQRSLLLRDATSSTSPINARILIAARQLHQSPKWRQEAVAEAATYAPIGIVEGEPQAVKSDSPRSNKEQPQSAVVAPPATSQQDGNGPVTRFADLERRGLVDREIVHNITHGMRLEMMTEVQTATINEALKGTDIIAQAKTGTGKTIAFLLPVLQKIITEDPSLAGRAQRKKRTTAEDIRAIIISPTRELAEQIAAEAERLTARTKIIVQAAVGGTQKNMMLNKTRRQGCHVLVGTPGRLKDILSDPYSGVKAPGLDSLVLDEADRLLDDGFWPEVESIMDFLPDQKEKDRQTLMFSATIPKEVVHIVRRTLKPGYKFVKCVRDDDAPTHERVKQKIVHAKNFENQLPALFELCQREVEKAESGEAKPFKAIVFMNSTKQTTLAASVFRNVRANDPRHPLHPARIIEIHSKLSQSARTRAAELFRNARSAILFSSDVTARGMDFPNVTHVIQIGLPSTRDTYIHRIGRTARAGKEGEGWLMVNSLEFDEASYRLKGLPLEHDHSLHTAKIDMTIPAQLPAKSAQILKDVGEAHKLVDRRDLADVYTALIGVFGWYPHKQRLFDYINQYTRYGWGLPSPPPISPALAGKLGLSRVRGLNFKSRDDASGDDRRGGDRGMRSSFGSDRGSDRYGGRGFGSRRDSDFGRRDSSGRDSDGLSDKLFGSRGSGGSFGSRGGGGSFGLRGGGGSFGGRRSFERNSGFGRARRSDRLDDPDVDVR